MRTTTLVSLLPITGLAQAAINITKSEQVDLATGTGELGWGALGLAFGYSAGVGFNFSDGMGSMFLFLLSPFCEKQA